jgi:hypothetical protein
LAQWFMRRCHLKQKFTDGQRTDAGRKAITKAHPVIL